MNIRQALKKRTAGDTISSQKIRMIYQTPETFLHWLIEDARSSNEQKLDTLKEILEAKDWKVNIVGPIED